MVDDIPKVGSITGKDSAGSAALADFRPLGEPVLDDAAVWAVLEAAPDGMLIADDRGSIIFVNGQLERLLGYDRPELLGQAVEVLVPAAVRGGHRAHRLRYRAAPTNREMGQGRELVARHRDGTEIPVEISLSPVATSSGVLTAVSVRDVSRGRSDDRARRRLLDLLDQVPEAVFVCDSATFRNEYVNRSATELLGYDRDELLLMTWFHYCPFSTEDGADEFRHRIEGAPGGQIEIELVVCTRSGDDVPVAAHFQRSIELTTGAAFYTVIVRDVRERRAWEAQLSASEEAFRIAFEQAPIGMAVTAIGHDDRRTIVQANEALAGFLGSTVEALIGRDFADLTHPDDRASSLAAARSLRDGTTPTYRTEKRYLHADGSAVWAELRAAAIEASPGDAARTLAHVIDISERHAIEVQREGAVRLHELAVSLTVELLAGVEIDSAHQLVASSALELLAADGAAMIVHAPGSGRADVIARSGALMEELERAGVAMSPEFLDGVGSVETVLLERPPESSDPSVRHLVGPVLSVPISVGGEPRGVVVVNRRTGRQPFDATDLLFLQAYVHQVGLSFELAAARTAHERLVVLEDRERIARDLHDTVIQDMFGIGLQLAATLPAFPNDDLRLRCSGMIDQIDETIRRLRVSIFELHHSTRTSASTVIDAIGAVLDEASRSLGFAPSLRIDGPVSDIEAATSAQMVTSLREALSNVARHANATRVEVVIVIDPASIEMTVDDDGVGPPEPGVLRRGEGLTNLHQRAASVGGSATLTRRAQGGARLTWTARRRHGH